MKFQVSGMSCGGCVKSVKKITAKTLDMDAEEVQVSLEAESLEVSNELSEAQINTLKESLSRAGFQLN